MNWQDMKAGVAMFVMNTLEEKQHTPMLDRIDNDPTSKCLKIKRMRFQVF